MPNASAPAPPSIRASLTAAAQRYAAHGRIAAGWARGKLLGDPVYAAVLGRVPQRGRLVDLGCGEGYLLAAVRAHAPEVALVGVDHDERRLALARAVLADEADVEVRAGDVCVEPIPPARVIALLDVLHYQPPADQDRLLHRAAGALAPGGVLIVRDVAPGRGLRSWTTMAAERLARWTGRHRGRGLHYRPMTAVADACRSFALDVELAACEDGTPFANELLVARRR